MYSAAQDISLGLNRPMLKGILMSHNSLVEFWSLPVSDIPSASGCDPRPKAKFPASTLEVNPDLNSRRWMKLFRLAMYVSKAITNFLHVGNACGSGNLLEWLVRCELRILAKNNRILQFSFTYAFCQHIR